MSEKKYHKDSWMESYEYVTWLLKQTPERALASLRHLQVCRLLGIAQRKYPYSERAEKLRHEVRRYYDEHYDL